MRAALTWMLLVLVDTGHQAAREIFLAPVIGALGAEQLGLLISSAFLLLIAWACSSWLKLPTLRSQLMVGGFWVALTLAFDFAVGRAVGFSWLRILSDYNPALGGYRLLELAVMFLSPWLTRRRR
jgi:hypothetical protein